MLSAYYVIRPIRDEMGAAGGVRNLPWLFSATLIAMLALNPLFAGLVRRMPRRRFIAWSYRFFALNLLVFAVVLSQANADATIWVGRAFFVWTSVFNLFVVSIFWALMVDVFDEAQGKRLFGYLAAGASLGAIAGSTITASAVQAVGIVPLLCTSVLLLELALFGVRRLTAAVAGHGPQVISTREPNDNCDTGITAKPAEPVIGGGVFAGLVHALRSPYLLAISLHMLLFAITSTFLYFQQIQIAVDTFGNDRGARTAFFAQIDLISNTLTLLLQLFLTSRLLRTVGVAATLAILPILSAFGFLALALVPTITVLVVLQVTRRVGNFALTRPTREILFTVVSREDKYKAKSAIDTAVYRLGDQIGSWAYAGLVAAGVSLAGIAATAVPLSLLWLANSLWLGRRQQQLAAAQSAKSATRLDSADPVAGVRDAR